MKYPSIFYEIDKASIKKIGLFTQREKFIKPETIIYVG